MFVAQLRKNRYGYPEEFYFTAAERELAVAFARNQGAVLLRYTGGGVEVVSLQAARKAA